MNATYVFTIAMTKGSKNAVQIYLSGIFAHKGGSIAILSDIGTESKNNGLNEASDKLGIERLFANLFDLQVTPSQLKDQKVHNSLKWTLT